MDTVAHIMAMPYVGPGIIAAVSLTAAWVMVYVQHKRHPEDFS